ncbi:MAG TPA: DEAD/DEAH box helicase [Chitinophagaceae bacterium]
MQSNNPLTRKVLDTLRIDALNPMQEAALETIDNEENVVILSATGSGKTLAFLLPILHRLDASVKEPQALIIAPSRELALQIESVFRSMGSGLKVLCCYGGHKREIEEASLAHPPALLIGTPGRLADHIRRGNIPLQRIEFLVLDEFDKTLELGFEEEVSFVIGSLPSINKRVLTSATESVEIPGFVGAENWTRLSFLEEGEAKASGLEIKKLLSPAMDKIDTLFRFICMVGNRSIIVFCNHRDAVERTSELLSEKGITNTFYHGAMEQRDRETAMSKFRNGTVNVLVTTDLAARGLDIQNIRYIIHYHLPATEDIFTHRNGRTARMDASGTAVLILNPEEALPSYVSPNIEAINLPEEVILPEKPKWTTLYISAGKKDKVNKVDVVGFLSNVGGLKKEDIGLIEVKDYFAYVAIRKSKASHTLQQIKNEKIKNKKVKIDIAK